MCIYVNLSCYFISFTKFPLMLIHIHIYYTIILLLECKIIISCLYIIMCFQLNVTYWSMEPGDLISLVLSLSYIYIINVTYWSMEPGDLISFVLCLSCIYIICIICIASHYNKYSFFF